VSRRSCANIKVTSFAGSILSALAIAIRAFRKHFFGNTHSNAGCAGAVLVESDLSEMSPVQIRAAIQHIVGSNAIRKPNACTTKARGSVGFT